MRRPAPNNPPQVHKSYATGALTPQEAASRLARLEFDIARLEREIANSEGRAHRARRQLAKQHDDRFTLLDVIARAPSALKKKK
ncbi:hypothetical protein GQ651_08805 [Alphaproteobacteria bacterium GH1-50]|uniref:Uncharacterized protein n=1 Tax=Kangsaoukella pontilimi TaxID=2691042 RepID=A0A7C9IG03_9RHOB|nr:hypothetical protein [Kangsaoukella pontilimi]MXQ07944.1 hypothetical protein [Kangsaoukella pontilimi]